MNKLKKILVVAAILAYPSTLEADTIFVAPSSTASSTVTAPAMALSVPPKIDAKTKVVAPAPAIQTITPEIIAEGKLITITAYASVPDETDNEPFITASGEHVADGIVAANFLPFGTKLKIPALFGDKIFTVEDRTSERFSNRLDVWMPSVGNAVYFGIRKAQIVILDSPLVSKVR